MVRTSLMALCLLIPLAGCATESARSASSTAAEAAPAPAPETPPRQSAVPGAQEFHATELRPGDCVEPLPQTSIVTVVPCDVPHSAEFATTYILPEGPYPAADMTRLMENGCLPRLRIKESKAGKVSLWAFGPTPDDWPRHRTVYCMAMPSDGRPTTGRVVK